VSPPPLSLSCGFNAGRKKKGFSNGVLCPGDCGPEAIQSDCRFYTKSKVLWDVPPYSLVHKCQRFSAFTHALIIVITGKTKAFEQSATIASYENSQQ
jgi:hypothetical protein